MQSSSQQEVLQSPHFQGSKTQRYDKFESLDYDVCDNTVHRADEASQGPADPLRYRSIKYGICCLLGIMIAITAFAVNFGVENIAGVKFWLVFTLAEYSYFGSWVVFTLFQTTLSVIAVLCVLYISPAATGSGIPDIKAYLNGVDVPAALLFRTLVAKVLGSLGSVSAGLAIGKEGPFVHIGACIASVLSQGGTWDNHPNLKWLKRFRNDRDRRDIVTCGAAAGVAAAFRAPVGGLLFGLEELSTYWSQHLLLTCFFTTAVVNVTVRLIMRVCSGGTCGFFGEGNAIIFHITDAQDTYEFYELFPMLLVAIIGGLLGALFNHLNAIVTGWRKTHIFSRGPRAKVLDAVAVAVLSSTVSFVLPLFSQCKKCLPGSERCPRADNFHSGNFVSFGCSAEDEYNDLATLFFNTQDDAIRNLFSSGTPHEYSPAALLIFFVAFYSLTIITYGISVPSGLFVPGILVGASYGRLVGIFVRYMHPTSVVDEGTYALLGSASYMAGSMRIAVSVCVMLLELTNQLSLLPMIMLVLVVSKSVGDGTGVPGIYDIQIEMKAFPFLKPKPCKQLRHISARELVSHDGPPVYLRRIERVRNIVRVLQQSAHNGFPVLDKVGELQRGDGDDPKAALLGIMLRHHLLVLLKSKRCFQHSPVVTPNSQRIAFMYDITDFDKAVSTESPTIDDIAPLLGEHLMNMYMDLAPYVNPPSYVVQESTNLSKVYSLFQTLGLRHLCVVPDTPAVVGILTRKDLLPERADEIIDNRMWSQHGPRNGSADSDPRRRSVCGAESANGDHSHTAAVELSVRPGRIGVVRSTSRHF